MNKEEIGVVEAQVKDSMDFSIQSSSSVRTELDVWLSWKEYRPISSHVLDGRLYVVVATDGSEIKYDLFRFFPMGDKWGTSRDAHGLDSEEMMHELLTLTN